MEEGGPQTTPLEEKSRTKFVLSWIAGGILVVATSGMLTYLILFSLYGAQDSLTSDKAGSNSTQTSGSLPSANRKVVATSHRDFGAVCGGFTISNAAQFEKRSTAKIVTFSQSPRTTDSWAYEDVGNGKTYTKTNGDLTKLNTVACLHEIRDTKVFAKTCQYQQDDALVSVRYYSIRYKLSYYEPRTGFRIADGGIIEAPAGECPSFVAYDPQTLTAYAVPDNDTLDVAHMNFITQ